MRAIQKSFAKATMGALNGESTVERGRFDGYRQGLIAPLIFDRRITPFEAVVKLERKTSTFGIRRIKCGGEKGGRPSFAIHRGKL